MDCAVSHTIIIIIKKKLALAQYSYWIGIRIQTFAGFSSKTLCPKLIERRKRKEKMQKRKSVASGRPEGTDGYDFNYRMVVESREFLSLIKGLDFLIQFGSLILMSLFSIWIFRVSKSGQREVPSFHTNFGSGKSQLLACYR